MIGFLRDIIFGRALPQNTELTPEVQEEFGKLRESMHLLNNEATKLRARVKSVELATQAIQVSKGNDKNDQLDK